MKDIKELEGLEIFLGYACNVKCSFCYQTDLRYKYSKNISYDGVVLLMEKGRKENKEFIIFSGGEPTLDRNLPEYIFQAKQMGYRHIRVHTNCFKFTDFDYLEDLYNKGLTGVIVSVHGYKKVHDSISKVHGSFSRIERALINFEKLKMKDNNFTFDTNTVICKENYKTLRVLFLFLLKFSVSRRMLVYPYNIDISDDSLQRILPKNEDYIPHVWEVCEIMNGRNIQDFVLETMPYCLIPKQYWHYIEENYKTNKDTLLVDRETNNQEQYLLGKYKLQTCKTCEKNKKCYGFSKNYVQLYGNVELNPIS